MATGAEDDFVLRLYLRDTRRAPRLTADEETSAAWLASFDDASGREQLVLGHLRLVVRIAYDYRGMGLTLGDLINEGNLGLMRATELFDPVRGVRFASYADASIRQRMRRALSYQAWPVRLPADLNWRQGQVQAIEEQLTGRLHREPDDAEVASACRLTLPAVRRLRSGAEPTFVSLDNPMPGEDEPGRVLAEVLPDEHSPAPDERLARRSDCEFAARLLATLRPAEQRVLRLRFGFGDGCERTLEEVGQELGYVRQGIHRIESVALAKLRQRVRRPEWC